MNFPGRLKCQLRDVMWCGKSFEMHLAKLHNASQPFKTFCVMKYLIDTNAAVIPPHENEEACVSVWFCWKQDVGKVGIF